VRFYAERMGRPGLAPGRYFRLLLIGYLEGSCSISRWQQSPRGIRQSPSRGVYTAIRTRLSDPIRHYYTPVKAMCSKPGAMPHLMC
jgi:hypothetical protein